MYRSPADPQPSRGAVPSRVVTLDRPLRVYMLGLRAFPHVQGGVETHAENLAAELTKLGCKIEVAVRSRYMKEPKPAGFERVRFIKLWSPSSKSLEAVVHSLLAVIVAVFRRPDIVHIHAIGPSLVAPIARLFGLKVVVTHHGLDYNRQKWSRFARAILRLCEMCGVRCANGRIAVSREIAASVQARFGRTCKYIPNGVRMQTPVASRSILETLSLSERKYVLMVGRLVPEKRQLDLISAFRLAQLPDWKLVLVGGADHTDNYSAQIIDAAQRTPDVVLTGVQSGLPLKELYSHAGMFVLPSSHEGFPIVLLEALSFGLPVIASRIPANMEVGLGSSHYFPLGDVNALEGKIRCFGEASWGHNDYENARTVVSEQYDWARLARETMDCYLKVAAT